MLTFIRLMLPPRLLFITPDCLRFERQRKPTAFCRLGNSLIPKKEVLEIKKGKLAKSRFNLIL